MQKALIIQTGGRHAVSLDTTELNTYLSQGWRFVSAAPFGVSVSEGGETTSEAALAAILVIIEKPMQPHFPKTLGS